MEKGYTIQDIAMMTGLNERTIRKYLAEGLRWAYQFRDGQARSILSGPPAALGELLANLQ